LKLEPDLDPEPEKLCEHRAMCIKSIKRMMYWILNFNGKLFFSYRFIQKRNPLF